MTNIEKIIEEYRKELNEAIDNIAFGTLGVASQGRERIDKLLINIGKKIEESHQAGIQDGIKKAYFLCTDNTDVIEIYKYAKSIGIHLNNKGSKLPSLSSKE